jgi:hypothetical protein
MDELICEVEAFAARTGGTPQKVLRDAIAAGGGQWASWKRGDSSPTMKVVDRLRTFMADLPAESEKGEQVE